jgi:hypothetical protein
MPGMNQQKRCGLPRASVGKILPQKLVKKPALAESSIGQTSVAHAARARGDRNLRAISGRRKRL